MTPTEMASKAPQLKASIAAAVQRERSQRGRKYPELLDTLERQSRALTLSNFQGTPSTPRTELRLNSQTL
jgi:hypothetical protein